MDPVRHQRAKQIFLAACELDAAGRAAVVERSCAGDPELRVEVEGWLAEHDRGQGLLDQAALPDFELPDARELAMERAHEDGPRSHPLRIGGYRILSLLGEGGMGVVYRALQETTQRTVALKVIASGRSSPERLRRFEHEVRLLARLQHPGICQIFEAGMADAEEGEQPFLAMELIQGQPLTEFAESEGLTVRQRLELLAKVCEAVHHAHQKGVVHRDLKPPNILVDRSRQPKVLDFGVARATGPAAGETTLRTRADQLLGTLDYMSPEQVCGDPEAVDTRSDVYALGVLAYELLTGKRPYDLRGKPLAEAAGIIREVEPVSLGSIDRRLRGDVETIVAKTLEKDPERRYASAWDLAADIRRHLGNQPIAARATSTIDQLRKFARRNRTLVAGLLAVLTTLVLGMAGTLAGAVRARDQRDRALLAEERARDLLAQSTAAQVAAETQAQRLGKVNLYLRKLLSAPDPSHGGPDIRVVDLLDRGSMDLAEVFSSDPETAASLHATIGSTYMSLGLFDRAEQHLERALEIREEVLGPWHSDALDSANDLATLHLWQGHLERAEALLAAALDAPASALPPENATRLAMQQNLAGLSMERGQLERAQDLYEDLRQTRLRLLGPDAADTLITSHSLAVVYMLRRRFEEAEPLLRDTLDRKRRVAGRDDPSTLKTLDALAGLLRNRGEYGESTQLHWEVLSISQSVLGPTNLGTLITMSSLAESLRQQGALDLAEALFRTALRDLETFFGPSYPKTILARNNLALLLEERGKGEEAASLYWQNLNVARGESHEGVAILPSMNNLASLLDAQNQLGEAEDLYRRSAEADLCLLGEDHPETSVSLWNLAMFLERLGRFDEAEDWHRQCSSSARMARPANDPLAWVAQRNRAKCLIRIGRDDEAEPLLLEACEGLQQAVGDAHAETVFTRRALVEFFEARGKPEEAAKHRARLEPQGSGDSGH